MKKVFDYTKTYTGSIVEDENNYPCSLAFRDSAIVFTLITEEQLSPRDHRNPFDFFGYIATERGIFHFKAMKAIQTSNSYTWSTYSRQEFTAGSLLVSHEKNDINTLRFRHATMVYNQLSEIGIYLNIDFAPSDTKTFTINREFEELVLRPESDMKITLDNPYSWAFKPAKNVQFSISSDPFITLRARESLNDQEINSQTSEIGFFFQLIFGMRQDLTALIFFDPPADELTEGQSALPFFYFHKQIIKNVIQPRHAGIPPLFRVEDMLPELPIAYKHWYNFDKKQKVLCRLFFNELNGREVVLDDRFKNLCAVIQGLNIFKTADRKEVHKGEMNRKLRNALDPELEKVLFTTFGDKFIIKLFEVIGDQRDFFQHLSKSLKFDLNENRNDIIAVNQLMATIVRYHLWLAVGLPANKIKRLVSRDIEFFRIDLFLLKQRLNY
jgi:hypothetical protein